MNSLQRLLVYLAFLGSANAAWASPAEVLKAQYPALYKLYVSNPALNGPLGDYALKQGFRKPFENLGVVIHERIHVESAAHQGFFIDGVYYEPYLNRSSWPNLTNEQVRPYMRPEEKGVIYSLYVQNTPDNHLGNVVDELNAYGHVLEFICKNEPESTEKQVRNILGFLHLQEAYLRAIRIAMPEDYKRLAYNRQSRGAVITVTDRAWKAMQVCGFTATQIPSQEVEYFAAVVKMLK